MKTKVLLLFFTIFYFQIVNAFVVDGINYNILSGTNVEVGSNTTLNGAITIPSNVVDNGITYTVSKIRQHAFLYSNITSISIPITVTIIGDSAFSNCQGLTNVVIPNSVTSLAGGIFYGCHNLTTAILPNSIIEIPAYTFWNCLSLTNVTYPNSITSIGEGAFAGCGNLTSINIPNSVTSIGNSAFSGTKITSIILPNSITSISDSLFQSCSFLQNITSITSIGGWAFSNCYSLTTVSIPNSVSSIGYSAFRDCTGLTSIICDITTPLVISILDFSNVYGNCILYVPDGSEAIYEAAPIWTYFSPIFPISALGLENFHNNFKVDFYPNPTNDVLNINSKTTILSADLFDLNGRKILSINPNSLDFKINLDAYESGIYLLKVDSDDGSSIQKIIKTN
jgi:hypothetical protein